MNPTFFLKNRTVEHLFHEPTKSNIHIYERQIVNRITIVKDTKGKVISIQNATFKPSSYKTIYNGAYTVVILDTGFKGIAKCNKTDKFSKQIGHDIAYNRAMIAQYESEIKEMSSQCQK